ncbi:MAG: hypothetical protein KC668_27770 [Myxococcales bacterium]|nr:hypothetical protein [Myxococcales bacterium]
MSRPQNLAGRGDALALSARHLKYCEHAARVLGWLSDVGDLTRRGVEVSQLDGDAGEVMAAITADVVNSPAVQAWMRWAAVSAITELDPTDALAFVRECTSFKETTAKKRASALASWIRAVAPVQLRLPGTSSTPSLPSGELAPHNEAPGESAWEHVVGDLRDARTLHILTGYASVERLVLAAAETDPGRLTQLRFHVGHEPYPGNRCMDPLFTRCGASPTLGG